MTSKSAFSTLCCFSPVSKGVVHACSRDTEQYFFRVLRRKTGSGMHICCKLLWEINNNEPFTLDTNSLPCCFDPHGPCSALCVLFVIGGREGDQSRKACPDRNTSGRLYLRPRVHHQAQPAIQRGYTFIKYALQTLRFSKRAWSVLVLSGDSFRGTSMPARSSIDWCIFASLQSLVQGLANVQLWRTYRRPT